MKIKSNKRTFPVFEIISFVILFAYALSLIAPFVWALSTSFKSNLNYLIDSFGFPTKFVNNYKTVLEYFSVPVAKGLGIRKVGVLEMLFNSVWYALGSSLILTCVSMLTGYIVASFNFKFCRIIYSVIIVMMIVPTVGTLASEIRLATALGLYNTPYGVLIMKAYVNGLYFLSFYATVGAIPKDYAEAAYLDGAGNFKVMVNIMLPMIKGLIYTVVLLNFISCWNDYQTPLVYMPSLPTLAYGLYYYVNGSYEQTTSTVPMRMAGCTLMAVPLFVLFVCFQKKLLGNITVGGLK